MANYGNPGDDSDEMFGDGPKQKMDEGDGMDEEGLLPKSLMAGKEWKVGDEIMLEITHIGEKDFGVKYASEKGKDKSDGDGEHEGIDTMTKKADADMEMEGSMY